ncbi:MAG: insulinase family protein, partial [Chloroflexota bacterium]|nr:insulinase family protein [Chloroflexota bacterium]
MATQIITEQLENGLTVAVEPMPHLRSVSWTLLVEAGSAGDPEGQSGAAQLISGMVYRGAGDRDARALSDALDALGVQRGGRLDREYATFGGSCLAADLHAALAIYADIVRRPMLPAEELDAERALALQAIAALNDNPAQNLFAELTQAYFPGPFGRRTLGSVDDLNRIDIGDLAADHQARFRPAGAVLAVAGGVDYAGVRQLADELFGDWQGAPRPAPRAAPRSDSYYQHLQQDTAQTQIGIAYAGLPIEDPDYYRARLGLNVLSGGMGARLFTEVREKRGLVYAVAAVPRLHRGAGSVLAYAGTQPDRAQETIDVLAGELRRLSDGVTPDELDRARTGLLSAMVMQGESTAARASAMASDVFLLGRPRT